MCPWGLPCQDRLMGAIIARRRVRRTERRGAFPSSIMQFGLFYEAPEDPRQTHAERYAEMLDLMAYGETLGFDVACMAEIHFGGAFSLISVPLMVVPVIAQRTRRV